MWPSVGHGAPFCDPSRLVQLREQQFLLQMYGQRKLSVRIEAANGLVRDLRDRYVACVLANMCCQVLLLMPLKPLKSLSAQPNSDMATTLTVELRVILFPDRKSRIES